MKLFIDLTTRRFVKSAASSAALPTLVLKRRDVMPVEVVFVQRGAAVATPAGTSIRVALKSKFSDANFLTVADSGTLDLYTTAVEDLFPGSTASADALLEVRWTKTGEATRTATLQAEIQNSVIIGDEGLPTSIPDYKSSQAEAEAGVSNDKWMTPLRTAQAIAALSAGGGGGGVTSYNDLTNKPTLGTAAATDATAYATAAQGAKADSALQSGTAIANISGLQTALDGKQAAGSYAPATGISPTAISGTAVVDSDARLTNSRQPTSHKSSHATGGVDAISPADIGASATGHTHPLSQIEQSSATNGQVPVWNSTTSAWVPQTPSATGGSAVQVFLASGEWTKPAGAKKVEVQIVGGGGGGGSGRKGATLTARSGGGGGGGGGVTFYQVDASTLPNAPATVSVVIGAGGLGGASQATNSTNGLIGADGGDTTFGIFRARGGFGGNPGVATTATGGTGGAGQFTGGSGGTGGGSAAGSNATGATFVSGGGGGGGVSATNTNFNGTNGGFVNSTNQGAAAGGANPIPPVAHGLTTALGQGGGGGNASQIGNAVAGAAAGLYGGGGGGGGSATDGVGNSGAGGKGGDGVVIVTSYF